MSVSFSLVPSSKSTFSRRLSKRSHEVAWTICQLACGELLPCTVRISLGTDTEYTDEARTLDDVWAMLETLEHQIKARGIKAPQEVVLSPSTPSPAMCDYLTEALLVARLWTLEAEQAEWEWDVAFLDAVPSGFCLDVMGDDARQQFVRATACAMAPPGVSDFSLLEAGIWMFHMYDSARALKVTTTH